MSDKLLKNEDFFVIRTPRMPIDVLLEMGSDTKQSRKKLCNWLDRPEVQEALYLASPSLMQRLEQWHKKPDSKQGKKVEQALLKYMIRMAFRPTPFGLFSGIHMGKFDSQSRLISHNLQQDKRSTRLDILYLLAIKTYLTTANDELGEIKYRTNGSHYFIANQCRYIEAYQSGENRQYRLSAVESDEYFQYLINKAENGATIAELAGDFLKQYPDTAAEEIENYIQQLIAEAALQVDISIPLLGQSPDHSLLEQLKSLNTNGLSDEIETALLKLEQLDQQKAVEIGDYKAIFAKLNKLPVKAKENNLFQTDVYRSFEHCELNQQLMPKFIEQLTLLKALTHKPNQPFENFIGKFNQRFEGQFVRLDKLLDEESGISFSNETGYDSPLLAGLGLGKRQQQGSVPTAPTIMERVVTDALLAPENQGKAQLQLKTKTLKQYLSKDKIGNGLPASFAAIVSLIEDKEQNSLIRLHGTYGPSAANLLGRFCHLDKDLRSEVASHLNKEQAHSPEVIFAEIAHMPEGRPGNVIARPHLRNYEIVFIADSSLPRERQIEVRDLYVWVEADQVKLWSKRLGKQVVPRLSSAHNYSSRSLSLYKFLSMLQLQSGSGPNFQLPQYLETASFIPRITLDNLILFEKTWRIPRKKLLTLAKQQDGYAESYGLLKNEYRLDDQTTFAVGDNVLLLDLRNPLMLEILLSETVNWDVVELKEALVCQYKSPVKSADGEAFNHEIIIPFFNYTAQSQQTLAENPQKHIQADVIQRRYAPGSEWLSVKIYSGNSTVENLLSQQLYDLIQESNELYDKWFFIRYSDPGWHLRLRFKGEPAVLWGCLLPKLEQLIAPLVEKSIIHKMEVSTYEREVERYGGPRGIALAESLFMADSQLVAATIRSLPEYGDELRWRVAMITSDQLLTEFGYDINDKLSLISQLRAGFGREFNETSQLRKQLGQKYKEVTTTLQTDLHNFEQYPKTAYSETETVVFSLVNAWKKQAQPTINWLNKGFEQGNLHLTKDSLLSSLLHMHNNRMFKAYGREHELLMHDFLRRHYLSKNKEVPS